MRIVMLAPTIVLGAILLATTPSAQPQAPAAASAGCLVRVEALDFGIYSVLSRSPYLTSGRVEVRCLSRSVTFGARVMLTTGRSGQYVQRTLVSGADVLNYNLFTDVGRRNIAGDGTQGTFALTPVAADASRRDFQRGTLGSARAVFRIYGKLDPGQLVPPGEYGDDLMVVVEF